MLQTISARVKRARSATAKSAATAVSSVDEPPGATPDANGQAAPAPDGAPDLRLRTDSQFAGKAAVSDGLPVLPAAADDGYIGARKGSFANGNPKVVASFYNTMAVPPSARVPTRGSISDDAVGAGSPPGMARGASWVQAAATEKLKDAPSGRDRVKFPDYPGYRITKKLDETPNCSVYRAVRYGDGSNRPVILKALDKPYPAVEDVQRYRNEFELLTKAAHIPGVVHGVALERFANDVMVMVLEDIGGQSIWQYLLQHASEQHPAGIGLITEDDELDSDLGAAPISGVPALGRIAPETVLRIALDVARTLAALHDIPIVHKDVTPQNMIWNQATGEVRLIDFAASFAGQFERPFELQGTLAWIPPEQTARINRNIDSRSDLYGLGASMYTMLTGRTPFRTSDPLELLHCTLAVEPPAIVDDKIPEMVVKIIAKLVKKSPEDRYQSAEGLIADLETCLDYLAAGSRQLRRMTSANSEHSGGPLSPTAPGEIPLFELGEYDTRRLEIPAKLYGREREISEIHRAFEFVASEHQPEVVLIGGYSGIGKTSMVWEAVATGILQRKGNFLKGKFDQMRSQPYHAILRAFGEFLRGILKEEAVVMEGWKARFEKVNSRLSTIMVDLIPELSYFLDEKKLVALPRNQAFERFNMAFFEFISVFLDESAPLVMFLDDMQWADLASLKLVENILDNITSNHVLYNNSSYPFLFIGSYRSNEVTQGHHLMSFFKRLQDEGITVNDIVLQPLNVDDVINLLADTVAKPKTNRGVQELAKVVFEKAGGNPFYIKQLLMKMYDEKMFSQVCDRVTRKFAWSWNMPRIRTLAIMDNVADILVATMAQLPTDSRTAIKTAACFGSIFTLEDLSEVLVRSPRDVGVDLHEPIDKGLVAGRTFFSGRISREMDDQTIARLIQSDKPSYVFLHDRIMQAAYELNSPEDLQATHLAIGRCLALKLQKRGDSDQKLIFGILEHYHKGLVDDLLKGTSPELHAELRNLVALNAQAGKLAVAAGAYNAGYKYYIKGLEFQDRLRGGLPIKGSGDPDYRLMFNMHYCAAEAAYLSILYDETNRLVELMDAYVVDPVDKAQVQTLQIRVSMARDRPQETILRSLLVLDNLGVNIPRNPNRLQLRSLFSEVRSFLRGRTDDMLVNLKDTSNQQDRFVVRILNDLILYTLHFEPRLYTAVALNYALRTFRTGHLAYGFVVYATLLAGQNRDFDEAYRFCKIALRRSEFLTDQTTKARTIVGALMFGIDYKESQREEVPLILNALDMAWETGDSEDMALCAVKLGVTGFWSGCPLRSLREEFAPRIVQTMRAIQRPMQQRWVAPYLQAIDCLSGAVDDPGKLVGEWIDLEEELQEPVKNRFQGDANAAIIASAMDMLLAYMWKDYRRAMRDLALLKAAQGKAKAYRSSEEVPFTWLEILVRIKNLWFAREEKRARGKEAAPVAEGLEAVGPALAIPEDEEELDMVETEPFRFTIFSELAELRRIKGLLKTLEEFATMAPMNQRHRFLIASAELAAYKGDIRALEFYEAAATEAKNRSFQWEYGLIRELHVEFLLSLKNVTSAKQVMREALHYYAKDGAVAKAKHLEFLYPQLISTKTDFAARTLMIGSDSKDGAMAITNSVMGESVDVLTLFKTTQAISRQLSIEKLLETLAGIVLESSGAQKVSFVVLRRNAPRIIGEGWIEQASADEKGRGTRQSYSGSEGGGPRSKRRSGQRLSSTATIGTGIANAERTSRAQSQPDLRLNVGTSVPDRRPSAFSEPGLSPILATDNVMDGPSDPLDVVRSGSFGRADVVEEIPLQMFPPMDKQAAARRASAKSADYIASAIAAANGLLMTAANGAPGSPATPASSAMKPSSRRGSIVEFANAVAHPASILDKRKSVDKGFNANASRRASVTIVKPEEAAARKQSYQGNSTERSNSFSGVSGGASNPVNGSDEDNRRPSDSSVAAQTNPNMRFLTTDKPVDYDTLPLTIVNYVIRTKESVVLDNAIADPRFMHDNYIVKYKPLSILAFPIGLQKNNMLGIAYLESRALTGVFTADRLYVLNIVFGQAGISLENARLYSAINKFVPNDMISQLSHESVVNVQLGDCIDTEMSVMFTDVRDFTSMSESMTARKTLNFLNAYLGRMQPVIEQNRGIIDKYFGDGILALWPTDPDHAVEAAMAMQRELAQFNQKIAQDNTWLGREIRIGVGVHTGRLMLGAIGSKNRIDMSVIGDTVNLASRLEGLTKYYKADVIVSEGTHHRLKRPQNFNFRLLDLVRPKGKAEAIRIYELIDAEYDEGLRARKIATKDRFNDGVMLYQKKQFAPALERFEATLAGAADDSVARMYRDRCRKMLEKIAGGFRVDNWDAVEVMYDK
ncbi:hypothetical protein DFJ74DRAFT_679984 [Hyaloraphidium curvatum]|nr:hypothetical protein DFJ74DRAFT_679984 [Hyaloraphidium curvatum]